MGKYDSKRLVYVVPYVGSTIKFGFLTNIDSAQSTQLGHTAVTGTYPSGFCLGANSPKPARASKQLASGTVSSFINAGSVTTARSQGWRIGKARQRRGGKRPKSVVVYVTIQGIKYAWNLPDSTVVKMGGITPLGIKQAASNEKDLVFGASSPTPPKATKVVGTGATTDVVTTFYDPTVTLPTGWNAVASGFDPLQAP